jgi:hypothetical protein
MAYEAVHAPQNLDANASFQPCAWFSFDDAKCGQGWSVGGGESSVRMLLFTCTPLALWTHFLPLGAQHHYRKELSIDG